MIDDDMPLAVMKSYDDLHASLRKRAEDLGLGALRRETA